MTLSRMLLMFLLMLSLMLCSVKTSAQNITTLNWSCLTREQKESIVIAIAENDECHKALEKATAAPAIAESWESIALVIALGFVGGMVLAQQIHH